MYLEKNLEKKWLIKSENKILGPYSFDQIIDLLRKKQISIIDEVRDPETRWLYVRENNEFKNIVEEIRKEIDSKQESTKTYQSTSGVVTSTMSFEEMAQKTKTDIIIHEDSPVHDEPENVQEAEVVQETTYKPVETTYPKFEKSKFYGIQTDENVQKKVISFATKLKIGMASAVFLLVAGYGGVVYFQKRNVIKKEEDLVLQIKKYKYLGLYEKAAEAYNLLPDASKKAILPSLLEIYPYLQKINAATLDDVKALKNDSSLKADQKSMLELINFWLAVKQLNYGQAQDYIAKAKTLLPLSGLPLARLNEENETLLLLKTNKYTEAYTKFKNLCNFEKNGRYLYGMMVSYLNLPVDEKPKYTKELLLSLEAYTNVYFDLRKELLLGQIFLARELNDESTYKFSLKQFFNTPTQLSAHFVKPSLLFPDNYNWKDLSNLKNNVISKLSGDDLILMQVHDLLEQDQLNKASEFISNNEAKVSSPQIKEQMRLLLLNAQGMSKDIVAMSQSKTLDMNSELNHLLLAQNQLQIDPNINILETLKFLESKQYLFYKDWLELQQLVGRKSEAKLKEFLKDHYITIDNFNPVFEARGMVN